MLPRDQWLTRFVGVVLCGCTVAVWGGRRVTMVTVHVDSDRLEYGFPLPAYQYGRSSGTWIVEALPLAVDFVVGCLVTLPLAALITRRLRPRIVFAVAIVTASGVILADVDDLVLLSMGKHRIHWGLPRESIVRCRALWLGPPEVWVADADPDDPCRERCR